MSMGMGEYHSHDKFTFLSHWFSELVGRESIVRQLKAEERMLFFRYYKMQFNCHIYLYIYSSSAPGFLGSIWLLLTAGWWQSRAWWEIKSSTLSPGEAKIIKTLETSCLIETLWTLKLLGGCHLSSERESWLAGWRCCRWNGVVTVTAVNIFGAFNIFVPEH